MGDSAKNIARGSAVMFFGLVLSKVLTYVYKVVVARYFGVSEYGLLSLSLSILAILGTICVLGLDSAVVRFVAEQKIKGKPEKIVGILYDTFKVSITLAIVVAVMLVALSSDISSIVFKSALGEAFLWLVAITLPIYVVYRLVMSLFLALRTPKYNALLDKITQAVFLIAITGFVVLLGYGVLGAMAAYTLSLVLTLVLAFYLLRNLLGKRVKYTKEKSLRRELLSFSIPLFIASVLWIILTQVDMIMIGYFKSPFEVGLYSAAVPIASLLYLFPIAINSVFVPEMLVVYVKGKKKEFERTIDKVVGWRFFLNYPLLLLFLLAPKVVIDLLFGRSFISSAVALSILAVGFFTMTTFAQPISGLLRLIKKTKYIGYVTFYMLILDIILNYLLIPKYSFTGAAIATSTSLIVGTVLFLFVGKREGISYTLSQVKIKRVVILSLPFLLLILGENILLAGAATLASYGLFFATLSKEGRDVVLSFVRPHLKK